VKGSVTTRLTRAYIREVGMAAVDLYSGELRRKAGVPADLSVTKKPSPTDN
jgi:hypothetical protein